MNLPNAKRSPRVEDDVIKWYEGDTFNLTFNITLRDGDGPVNIAETDTVTCNFFGKSGLVETKTFTDIKQNAIRIFIDEDLTKKFPKGVYRYDIIYKNDSTTTICKSNYIEVE